MAYEMVNKMGFEIETCSRCGGSGQYSYNQMTGSRCFKCHGQKYSLTKRGAAAREFFTKSQYKDFEDLKVGMYLWQTPMGRKGFWSKITSIEPASGAYAVLPDGSKLVYNHISCEKGDGIQTLGGIKLRAVADNAEYEALKQAALDYQGTLGKGGKPMKRKAA